jgi:WD40 repeat protein
MRIVQLQSSVRHFSFFLIAISLCFAGHAKISPSHEQFGPTKGIYCVAFTPDGHTVVAAGFDDPAKLTITLWDVTSGTSHRTLTGPSETNFNGFEFSPDRKTLATGSTPNTDDEHFTVTLWDLATGKSLHAMSGHTKEIDDIAFSPDGHTLASASQDQSIKLWDVATGKLLRTINDTVGMPGSVAFSSDGHTLASSSNNYPPQNDTTGASPINTIDIWDATTGKSIHTTPPQKEWTSVVAFSPDGHILASADWNYTITLWNSTTWQPMLPLTGHTDVIDSFAFTPDGHTLASASIDGTIRLWDVSTGQTLRTLTGHTDAVTSVSFTRDGHTLVSGSTDNTIKLWDVSTGKLLRTFGTPNPAPPKAHLDF